MTPAGWTEERRLKGNGKGKLGCLEEAGTENERKTHAEIRKILLMYVVTI